MSAAAPLARTGFKFLLKVTDGPDAGATFQLLPPHVTIGRGADCHVVLNDPRVSRMAATIDFSMEQIILKEVSIRQVMAVNGVSTSEASIKDGDIIQIGDSVLGFIVEALHLPSQQSSSRAMAAAQMQGRSLDMGSMPQQGPRANRSSQNANSGGLSGRVKLYGAVAVLGLAMAWLLMSDPPKPRKDPGPVSADDIQKEIDKSEKRQDEIIQKRVFKNDAEKTRYEEAQRHFNEGFRDYQKGQWGRAMRSFEIAITIDSQHALARRYYKLSEKARDQMISDLTLEGRRYREKSMWARCSAQFEKVLDLIPNKDDMKYKAAEAMKKECDLQLEGRFR